MPACLTHNQFARLVLERLPNGESLDKCAYYWGAQGPDFLFCHRYLPVWKEESISSYALKLHETKPSLTFNAMREFLKKHEDNTYRSYVMGFVCHYALDAAAHPYINALAAKLLEERPYETVTTLHGEIEGALDAITLRRETGKLPSEVNVKNMFPKNEGVQRKIARLYSEVIFSVYGESIPEETLYQASKDAHFIFAALNDRTGVKYKFFDILEKGRAHKITSHIVPITENPDIDYANIQKTEWESKGVTSDKSFFEMFDEAQELALTLQKEFDTCDFAALTGDRLFAG